VVGVLQIGSLDSPEKCRDLCVGWTQKRWDYTVTGIQLSGEDCAAWRYFSSDHKDYYGRNTEARRCYLWSMAGSGGADRAEITTGYNPCKGDEACTAKGGKCQGENIKCDGKSLDVCAAGSNMKCCVKSADVVQCQIKDTYFKNAKPIHVNGPSRGIADAAACQRLCRIRYRFKVFRECNAWTFIGKGYKDKSKIGECYLWLTVGKRGKGGNKGTGVISGFNDCTE